ncbi:Calx-beta domain-containing protein, partial [Dolichospermum planctonicum CS-1226]
DGNDTLNAGDGNDYLNGGKGINSIIGGAGSDKLDLDYTTTTNDITINYSDLNNGTISDGSTFKEVERIYLVTGSGNDNIDISATDNSYRLYSWDDWYYSGNRWQYNDTKVYANNGNDTVIGGSGGDEIYGQGGNDILTGNAGNDKLVAGEGDDILNGGAGDDELYGEDGNDTLNGGEGNNYLYGHGGNDLLDSGDGNDELYGGAGNDILTSKAGNDKLVGGEGDDILNSGAGDDYLSGEDGNDTLNAGDGNDYLNGGKGINSIIGGAGSDKLDLDYTTTTNDITINYSDLNNGTISDGSTFKEVERIYLVTGSGNDNIDISATDNSYQMYWWTSDWWYSSNRWQYNDTKVYANNGNDTVIGGSGGDEIYGQGGNDILTGNAGNDKLVGGRGNDILNGGTGDDELYGENDNDILDGGLGNDTLNGGSGTDTLKVDYSAITTVGISTTVTTPGSGTISAGNIVNYSNIEKFNITGTTQADNLIGGNLDDTLIGGNGNDTITGGTGADSLVGGRGDDIYIVDELGDIITESSNQGLDTVRASITYSLASIANVENLTLTGTANINATGNDINNILTGNIGNNTLNGAAGNDRLIGVDETSATPGKAEVDTLIGGAGRDRFVLGNSSKVFYDDGDTTNDGTADYALIQDFNASEDFIELSGLESDYTLNTTYSPGNTAIYRNKPTGEPAELIGIIEGVTGLDLSSPAFINFAYFNDFETAAGTEWSNQTRSITPVGGRNFLGEFGNDTVSLTLNNQGNSTVTLEFDLFILKSWDGSYGAGPDIFTLSIAGGQTLLNTTFSNVGNEQAYPGTFGSATYPGRTGAIENNTLGYWGGYDSVYRISSTFQAPSSNLKLNFAGSGLQDIGDESWGLDNVKVTTFTTPTALSAGTLAFSQPTFQVNEDGTTVAAVTVTRSGGSNGEVRATITSQGQTATNWGDFDPTAIDVTFGHGDTTAKVITIPIYNDFKAESDETLLLTLTNAVGGAAIGTQNTATLTIVDNNDAPVTYYLTNAGSWTDAQAQAQALGGNLVTINDPTENQFLVTAFGSEYFWIGLNDIAAEGNFAWVNGESSKYTNWYYNQPDNSNNEDYVFMNYGSGTWADISNNSLYRGIVEVVNGVSTLSVGNVSIDEEAGKITVTVTLTGVRPDKTFTVDYSTADVTATAGQDYTATNGTLTFNPGESVKTFTIDINNDTVYEGNETFNVTLSNPTGGAVLGQNVSTITLTETPPVLAFSQPTFIVKEDGTGTTQITVTRTGSPDNTVSATISLTNGQAVAPDDYNNSAITVSFAPGESSKVVNIPLVDDIRFEEEEDLTLTLSNPTNSAIIGTQATAKLTIQDNDINQGIVLNQAIPVIIDNTKLKVSNVGALTGNAANIIYTVTDLPDKGVLGFCNDTALSFNGVDNYVEVPHSAALSLNTFTLEAWVNQTQIKGDWQPIITKEANNGYEVNYGLYIEPNVSRLYFGFQDSNGNWRYIYPSQASLTLNQLTHVAATYDGAKLSLYINGQLDSTADFVGTPLQNNYPVKIGRELNAWTPFAGQIDDVRIWNVARTQAQIQANLNKTLTGTETGLAAYWNFNNITGNTATDLTTNGNNGTIYGATNTGNPILSTVTPLKVGDRFTQGDIDSGKLIYQPGGSSIQDFFQFNLTDGTNTVTNQTFFLSHTDQTTNGTAANQTLNGTASKDKINGLGGDDILNGGADHDLLQGGTGNDTLNGEAGNDFLYGGVGNDILRGGTGDDSYLIDSITETITENANEGTDTVYSTLTFSLATLPNVENLILTGIDAINGTGNAGNNVITGNNGNNSLDGGAGTDTLIGGLGDDIYIVDSTTDTITENANEGTDTIQSSVAYTIAAANVENLTLTGTGAINGTGNATNNVITGNDVNNTLNGGDGNDTLNGGAGRDTLIGGLGDDIYIVDSTTDIITENANEGTDTIQSSVTLTMATNVENLTLTGTAAINGTGNAGNNVITGNGGNNTLNGGAGTDTLIGGAGRDTLIGGTGDDIYIVDSATDTITEQASGGIDTIQSSVTLTIATNVENLTLTGTAAIKGTGNAGNNVITGNDVNNTLNGGAGTDTLIGGLGDDVYIVDSTTDTITENANEGMDTIQSSVTYTIVDANVENLILTGTAAINGTGNAANNVMTGNSGNNTLNGGDGNDTLNGGAGTDTLIGGLGDDVYIVDSTTDTITENANEGIDTIQSSVTYTIVDANVENLTLTGTKAINGTGNAGNNVITGNSANNSLNGGDGNDILTGRVGKDTLTGGLGTDRFDYRTLSDSVFSNFDVITDFNATTDLFLVSNTPTGFSNAGRVTTLNTAGITARLTAAAFTANSAAQFTFGTGISTRTFVAINDATAGFSATTDAIIEVTGFTGTLGFNNFTTALV